MRSASRRDKNFEFPACFRRLMTCVTPKYVPRCSSFHGLPHEPEADDMVGPVWEDVIAERRTGTIRRVIVAATAHYLLIDGSSRRGIRALVPILHPFPYV